MEKKSGFLDILFGGVKGSSQHPISAYRYLENIEEMKANKLEQMRRQQRAKQLKYNNMLKPMEPTRMMIPEFRPGIIDKGKKR